MAPPFPAPQPEPRRKGGCLRNTLIGVGVVTVLGIAIGVGASSGSDDDKSGGSANSAPQQADASAPAVTADAGGKEADDVKIASCKVESPLHWPKAELTITNSSSKKSTYFINLEFVDAASGVRLSETAAIATNVAPGQVVQETAQGTGEAEGKTITCRITRVDRTVSH